MTQTHKRKSRAALPPHVVNQNGGGKRVWTEAAVPPTTSNWRTGSYEVGDLRDFSLRGMVYDTERQSGDDFIWIQRRVGVLGKIRRYLRTNFNFPILDGISQWLE